MSDYEIPKEKELQSLALHTVFAALGKMQVLGYEGSPSIAMDDLASVRQTFRWHELSGKTYLYTTNVTVSVSRVELK